MTANVITVPYLDGWMWLVSGFQGRFVYGRGVFLTSTTAVFGGSADPEDLKSLARDSRVMNSRSERDIVDIVRAVV